MAESLSNDCQKTPEHPQKRPPSWPQNGPQNPPEVDTQLLPVPGAVPAVRYQPGLAFGVTFSSVFAFRTEPPVHTGPDLPAPFWGPFLEPQGVPF